MTMADTVAVMNAGRIEQMGHPADIYELPRTAFVANFLGQSNLIQGRKQSDGDVVTVVANGITFRLPSARNSATGSSVIVGVRPEKMTVLDAPDADRVPSGHNAIYGRVTDVSYTGVSTQYIVRTAWDYDLIAFEQNDVVGDRCEVGDDVIIHWAPEHTFGLDGSEDIYAGVDEEILALELGDEFADEPGQ